MSTPPGSGSPPPGWYPDPQGGGGQRYWDGARWTEHTAPPATAPAAPPTPFDPQARQWALFAHLSALAALVIGFNWLGPLIIYLVKKDADPFIRDHAKEALNFNLSVFLYGVVGAILTFVLILILIGLLLIPVLIALAIAWVVFVIIAAVKANRGEPYRYPLTIRFVS
jgi:uncharacterized Tic20 family protein